MVGFSMVYIKLHPHPGSSVTMFSMVEEQTRFEAFGSFIILTKGPFLNQGLTSIYHSTSGDSYYQWVGVEWLQSIPPNWCFSWEKNWTYPKLKGWVSKVFNDGTPSCWNWRHAAFSRYFGIKYHASFWYLHMENIYNKLSMNHQQNFNSRISFMDPCFLEFLELCFKNSSIFPSTSWLSNEFFQGPGVDESSHHWVTMLQRNRRLKVMFKSFANTMAV